jgi:hypothetical protein
MKILDLIPKGWVLTDGSYETLQLGKKITDSKWFYREWVSNILDSEEEQNLTSDEKLKMWDSGMWREQEIDLEDYDRASIEDFVSSFGYEVSFYSSPKVFNLKQNGYTYSVDDSIQLACECIFELS